MRLRDRGWARRITFVVGTLLFVCAHLAGSQETRSAAAFQANPICAVGFDIESDPTVEAEPGETVTVPYSAVIDLLGFESADLVFSITLPADIAASFAPAQQTIAPPDPFVQSSWRVVGSVVATVPQTAQGGTSYVFSPNSATLTCYGASREPQTVTDSDAGFRIVVSQPPPTATATATATSTPTPTATATSTPTPSPTATSTATATATASPSPTPTDAPSPTSTSTSSPTASASPTSSASPTATATSTSTATSTPTEPESAPGTATATVTASASASASPTSNGTATEDETPTGSPTDEATSTQSSETGDTATPDDGESPDAGAEPTNTPTAPPSTIDIGGGIVLEISELRTEEEADDSPSTGAWLRTSAGTLGVILLAAGAYGIWRGNGRHDLNA